MSTKGIIEGCVIVFDPERAFSKFKAQQSKKDDKMAKEYSETQDVASDVEGITDLNDLPDLTEDGIDEGECSDEDLESCSSDSSLGGKILIHLVRRPDGLHQGRSQRSKTKREANETLVDGVSKECAAKNAEELLQEEEREKQKAEKRKAKKKRRKEKKKEKILGATASLNKNINNSNTNDNSIDNISKNNVSEDAAKPKKKERINGTKVQHKQEAGSEDDVEEDDFLDPNSAFVTNAANKNKLKHFYESRQKKTTETTDVDYSAVEESEKLAAEGYIAAEKQQYQEAVNCFTRAISLIKNDYRFYSNRSFCYCQLGQYTKGLKDADKAIQYFPDNPKGYFRRGEALKNLKQYKEAEEAFEKALQLDPNIKEAWQELENLKVQQLLDMGFELKESRAALQKHNSIQAAVEVLSATKNILLEDEDEVFYSDDDDEDDDDDDDEEEEEPLAVASSSSKRDSLNPLGLSSLWIGNVTERVSAEQLEELFSGYGQIASIKILPQSFCAFVNFKDKNAAGPAMKQLQGVFLGGQRLTIRFPNNAAADVQQKAIIAASSYQIKTTGPVNANECHFWRTTGCVFGDKCRYKHVREHKGIDKKPWHRAD